MKKKFLYVCGTIVCLVVLVPVHPIFLWFFLAIGAYIVAKWAIDKTAEWD